MLQEDVVDGLMSNIDCEALEPCQDAKTPRRQDVAATLPDSAWKCGEGSLAVGQT